MKKLELKHLAPYLPYNVKLKYDISQSATWWLDESNIDVVTKYDKLILRPLSDLTKEIGHNGEKFVPMFRLFEIEYTGTSHVYTVRNLYVRETGRFLETSHHGTAATTSINILNISLNNYWKIEKLLEWHFDIFELIEKGLAIDINTLK